MNEQTRQSLSERVIKHKIDELMGKGMRGEVYAKLHKDPYKELRGEAEQRINELDNVQLLELLGKVLEK